jgi:hypothetical protein
MASRWSVEGPCHDCIHRRSARPRGIRNAPDLFANVARNGEVGRGIAKGRGVGRQEAEWARAARRYRDAREQRVRLPHPASG